MRGYRLLRWCLRAAAAILAAADAVLSVAWFVGSPGGAPAVAAVTAPARAASARLPQGLAIPILPNPLERPPAPAPPPRVDLAALYGVGSTSAPLSATLVRRGTGERIMVRLGEWLTEGDLRGWCVAEIGGFPDERVVLEVDREQVVLTKVPAAPAGAAAGPSLRGVPYDPSRYQSRRGFVDPEELRWLAANWDLVLANDVRLSGADGGGVRLDWVRPGSILEARGFQAGDIVTEVNRRRVAGPQEVQALIEALRGEAPQQVYLRINRAGRAIVLVWRVAPG